MMLDTFPIAGALPVVALALYFGLGLVAFSIRCAWLGQFHDAEMSTRGSSVLLGSWLRHYFVWVMQPVINLLVWCEITPDAVSGCSVLIAGAAGVAAAAGQFALGGWLYLVSGMGDYLDGRLARVTGQSTARGAALDSILDRYAEAAMIIGLAWYYRDGWMLLALLLFLCGSFLVPYVRARGEGLGVDTKVGLMQRPERVVILGLATALSPLADTLLPQVVVESVLHPLVVAAVVLMAASTQATAAYRLWHVAQMLDRRSGVPQHERLSRTAKFATTAATIADFATVILAVEQAWLPAWLAVGVSCALCSAAKFAWLKRSGAPEAVSLRRAAVLAIGGGLLNAGGLAAMSLAPAIDYRLSWIIVRLATTWGWNLPLRVNALQTPKPIEQQTYPKATAA